jgi:hypothetical protein
MAAAAVANARRLADADSLLPGHSPLLWVVEHVARLGIANEVMEMLTEGEKAPSPCSLEP